jgi:hypothetical protein
MSQRDSGYERKERDLYETPEWVTMALLPHLQPDGWDVWEPAAGTGKMVRALSTTFQVYATDIDGGCAHADFLKQDRWIDDENYCSRKVIITNPPYDLATEFCEHALRLTEPHRGLVAMLLRTDFDHAKSRSHLFRDCPAFAKKVVLTRRIVWFEPEPGSKGKSPSFNHAWFIWDWEHEGPPTIGYGP